MEKKKKTISTLTTYSIHFAFRVEKKKKSLGELDSRSCLVLDNSRVIYFFPLQQVALFQEVVPGGCPIFRI